MLLMYSSKDFNWCFFTLKLVILLNVIKMKKSRSFVALALFAPRWIHCTEASTCATPFLRPPAPPGGDIPARSTTNERETSD